MDGEDIVGAIVVVDKDLDRLAVVAEVEGFKLAIELRRLLVCCKTLLPALLLLPLAFAVFEL